MSVILTHQFDLQAAFPLNKNQVVNTIEERDGLQYNRYEGLITYVREERKFYALVGGITNEFWQLIVIEGDDGEYIPLSWLDIDPLMAANSDKRVPSQKAVKTLVENQKDRFNICEW